MTTTDFEPWTEERLAAVIVKKRMSGKREVVRFISRGVSRGAQRSATRPQPVMTATDFEPWTVERVKVLRAKARLLGLQNNWMRPNDLEGPRAYIDEDGDCHITTCLEDDYHPADKPRLVEFLNIHQLAAFLL